MWLFVLGDLPVLELRQQVLQVGADLDGRKGIVCHVGRAEIDQRIHALIRECAVRIAPLAVILVERAVRFAAHAPVFERHAAALADELPRRTEQRVDRDVKKAREQLQRLGVRDRLAPFTYLKILVFQSIFPTNL